MIWVLFKSGDNFEKLTSIESKFCQCDLILEKFALWFQSNLLSVNVSIFSFCTTNSFFDIFDGAAARKLIISQISQEYHMLQGGVVGNFNLWVQIYKLLS